MQPTHYHHSTTRADQRQEQRPRCTESNLLTVRLLILGKTGRNLKTRLNEHKRATKNGDIMNYISEHHHLQQKLPITTLESWYTNSEQDLCTDVNSYLHLTNDSYMTTRNRQTDNRRIENSKKINWPITTIFTFWGPMTKRQNWPIRSKTGGINTIIWRRLFTSL